jgi:hypothetical protein
VGQFLLAPRVGPTVNELPDKDMVLVDLKESLENIFRGWDNPAILVEEPPKADK